jgi:hypothetical protein
MGGARDAAVFQALARWPRLYRENLSSDRRAAQPEIAAVR